MYDSARAYHAGQTVLLNVDTGRWVLLDPQQLCGLPRREWNVDRKLVAALQAGKPTPWASMRGVRYRLRVRLDSLHGDRFDRRRGERAARTALARLVASAIAGLGAMPRQNAERARRSDCLRSSRTRAQRAPCPVRRSEVIR